MYQADGSNLYCVHCDDERTHAAHCGSNVTAVRAAELLNRARTLNDVKRQYTAAARLIAKVETLDGFEWVDEPVSF